MSNTVTFNGSITGQNVVAAPYVSEHATLNIYNGPDPRPRIAPFSMIPFPPDPNFVQRPSISKWLREATDETGSRAALVGLGGVGKSQIVIQHACDIRRDAPDTWVFWVHASSVARFQEAYRDIAGRLQLPGWNDPQQNVFQLVHRWLTHEDNGPWLMIVDNADDSNILRQSPGLSGSECSLASYIPTTGRGSVIVTSRSMRAAEMLVGDDSLLAVPVMDNSQAKQLLRVKLGEDLYKEGEESASGLLAALDCLPLAIVQTASFIKRRSNRGSTISNYLEEFQESREKKSGLLSQEATDLRRDKSASKAVVTTWQMTFDQVLEDRASAAELLFFISFLHPQGIPDSLLIAFSDEMENKDLEHDIEVLVGYSLVATTNHTLELHALVQLCTQAWLSTFDDLEKWRCKYVKVMSIIYPLGTFENWPLCRTLDPHVQSAVERCPIGYDDVHRWSVLLENVVVHRQQTGRFDEAETMSRRYLSAMVEALGEKNLYTLTSLICLGNTLVHQMKFAEAEIINRRGLKTSIKMLGTRNPCTTRFMGNLAWVLDAQGKHREATTINRKFLKASTKVPEDPDSQWKIIAQTRELLVQGKHSEADMIIRQALDARIKVLGQDHPTTLQTMFHLEGALFNQGKYSEAETMNRQTLKARRRVLGQDHPDTLTSMSSLAQLLYVQGKHSEAEKAYRECLEARRRVLGQDHPDTLSSMSNLAWLLYLQDKSSEAEKAFRECLEGRRRVIGQDHPDALNDMSILAWILYLQGKHSEAEKMYRECLEARTKVLGKEHHDTKLDLNNLGLVLRAQGKDDEAEISSQRHSSQRRRYWSILTRFRA